MAFPPQFMDELRSRLPVSEVVGRKVRLIRRGREHTGLCPFHNEKTPSFTVNDDKGFYHCFGCGAHGDVISFAMETEGLSFPEAVEKLAGLAGLAVPQVSPEERERHQAKAGLQDVVELACEWFESQLAQSGGRAAYDYLRGRGFTDETIGRFRLGYAPDGRGRLGQALEARGVTAQQLAEAGLVKPSQGGPARDYFFNRVMFPITDRRGKIIAFGGRILGDGQPKYLNSPDTPLFHKGRVLYNWAQAREAAHQSGTIYVVEGYTDVIALAQEGIGHAVAPLGTALTEEQMLALWRMVDEPILCFDGDTAGQRAAWRAAQRALPLLQPGKSLRFIALPSGDDPDSLVKARGRAGFERVAGQARPLFDLIWMSEVGQGKLDTPERRAALERRLGEHIREIADGSVQHHYRQLVRERLRELFSPPRTAARGGAPGRNRGRDWGRNRPPEPPAIPAGLAPRGDVGALKMQQERVLLALVLNHPELISGAFEGLSGISLQTEGLDRILQEILNVSLVSPELDSAALQRHLIDSGFQHQLTTVLNTKTYRLASFAKPEASIDEAARALDEIIVWHRRHSHVDKEVAAAKRDLADDMTATNSDRLLDIVRERTGSGRY